ncbi:MAG: hypothetical protein IJ347_09795 [Faecalibacterium sp.]|nr:hypothetical protein [Faecalibacterium sp.]
MNKKKILVLAMTLSMVAILAIGGTIAYFTDTDIQTNVFTTGNVKIDLFEDFGDNNDDTLEKLIPTTGKTEKGNQINGIEKEAYVENTGSEDAFVRIHFAIPDILDSGAKDIPALNASDNIVHWNHAALSTEKGLWSWLPEYTEGVGYIGNGEGNWNVYQDDIDGITYNVYVATYRTALKGAVEGKPNDVTCDAINQVYMDAKTTNEQIETLKKTLGDQWKIYVVAEATSAQGFDNAYVALDTAFGKPGTYEVAWNATPEGDKFWEDTQSKNEEKKGWDWTK